MAKETVAVVPGNSRLQHGYFRSDRRTRAYDCPCNYFGGRFRFREHVLERKGGHGSADSACHVLGFNRPVGHRPLYWPYGPCRGFPWDAARLSSRPQKPVWLGRAYRFSTLLWTSASDPI